MIDMMSKYQGVLHGRGARKPSQRQQSAPPFSQSAVSQTIKALEQELGTTLLSRQTHRLPLTRDGEKLPSVFAGNRGGGGRLERRKKPSSPSSKPASYALGRLRASAEPIFRRVFRRFPRAIPACAFPCGRGSMTRSRSGSPTGASTWAFTNMDAYPPQEGQLLFEDRMIAVLLKSHPLARRAEISLKDLAGEPFLMLDEGKFSVVRRASEKEGLTPDVRYFVYDDYTILSMVQLGLGNSMPYERGARI